MNIKISVFLSIDSIEMQSLLTSYSSLFYFSSMLGVLRPLSFSQIIKPRSQCKNNVLTIFYKSYSSSGIQIKSNLHLLVLGSTGLGVGTSEINGLVENKETIIRYIDIVIYHSEHLQKTLVMQVFSNFTIEDNIPSRCAIIRCGLRPSSHTPLAAHTVIR